MPAIFDSLLSVFAGGSPERQNVSIASSNIWDIFGGTQSSAGVMVNNETALGYPAVWRGVNLLATQVAKLPALTYRRLPAGGKDRDRTHPAYRLLRNRPNAEMTSYDFIMTLMGHALLHRGGYAWINRSGSGDAVEMIPLNPLNTWPLREDGLLLYRTMAGGREFRLLPENVFHVKGLSWDGLTGYSVIDKLREAIGLGLAMQGYGSRYFKNNARPNMVIELPGHMKDEESINRFRASWNQAHAGIDNAHRAALLEDGAKVSAFNVNHEEAQFMEAQAFSIRQVANIINVPPHKLGDTTRTAFASLEQENQSFLDESLDPWLRNIEEEANAKLLRERERDDDTHTIEFMRQALVRADFSARTAGYAVAILNRWMSPNEVRERENLNPYPGGDEFVMPMNMGGGDAPDTPPDEEDEEDDDTTIALGPIKALLTCVLMRMVNRLGTHARRAARKPETYHAWLDGMRADHENVFEQAVWPVLATIEAVAGDCRSAAEVADEFFAACHGCWLEAGDGDRATFAQRVDEAATRLATSLPDQLAGSVIHQRTTYKIAGALQCQPTTPETTISLST